MAGTCSLSEEKLVIWEMKRACKMNKNEVNGIQCEGSHWIPHASEHGHECRANIIWTDIQATFSFSEVIPFPSVINLPHIVIKA
jgi:hypothetical protein